MRCDLKTGKQPKRAFDPAPGCGCLLAQRAGQFA